MDEARSVRDAMTMTGFFSDPLAKTDPEVAAAIADELVRQQDQIEMIASGKHCQCGGDGSARFRSDK